MQIETQIHDVAAPASEKTRFEIAGVMLLAAIIAAITLAHRAPYKRKEQNPSHQIEVRPEERLHLIKMPAEKKKGV